MTRAALIDVKKGDLTLKVGDEKVHFNINQSLKQPEFDNFECKIVEQVVCHAPNPGPTRLVDPNWFPGRKTQNWDSLNQIVPVGMAHIL